MPKKLMALNLVLAAAAALFVVYIARQVLAPMPMPVGSRRTPPPATAAAATETPRAPAGAYNVVAARNLFSPARAEGPSSGMAMAGGPLVRPNLYGVVVRESGSIAYLEDPTTKRVAGYRVGDRILGGTVQAIKSDAVTIDAPGGAMDVRLHDPGKPRATPAAVTGVPQPAATPLLPGMIPPLPPPAVTAAPPQAMQQPPMPAAQPPMVIPGQPPTVAVPGQPPVVNPPVVPGRRALPPNLLRRVPPGMGDAPQQ